jgi:hypothetical protein
MEELQRATGVVAGTLTQGLAEPEVTDRQIQGLAEAVLTQEQKESARALVQQFTKAVEDFSSDNPDWLEEPEKKIKAVRKALLALISQPVPVELELDLVEKFWTRELLLDDTRLLMRVFDAPTVQAIADRGSNSQGKISVLRALLGSQSLFVASEGPAPQSASAQSFLAATWQAVGAGEAYATNSQALSFKLEGILDAKLGKPGEELEAA